MVQIFTVVDTVGYSACVEQYYFSYLKNFLLRQILHNYVFSNLENFLKHQIFCTRVSGTNIGPVFPFVFDRLNIDHYLTSSSSTDGKFHALRRYVVEIGKKLSINYV